MKTLIRSLKAINYQLFLSIFVMMLFPSIYQTVRIYFLGEMPSDWGVNIASQLSWINLLYEIIQEALILPLFYILGKSLNDKEELENKIKSGFLLTGTIYFIISLLNLYVCK